MVAVERDELSGVVNAVAPEVVTNLKFTKALGRALRRPTWFPVPVAVVRGMYGEMATETILTDLAVKPQRLSDSGFVWHSPTLELALAEALA